MEWLRRQLYLDELASTSLSSESVLFKLVKDNRLKTIKDLLMTNQIHVDDIVFRTTGHALLHECVVMDRYEIFMLALHYKADLDKGDKGGASALMKACALGRMSMVKRLVERGALVSQGVNGEDCLDKARKHEQWQVVDYLESHNR